MRLKLTGDKALFHADVGEDVVWDVNGAIPLGSVRHLASLKEVLRRDFVDEYCPVPH